MRGGWVVTAAMITAPRRLYSALLTTTAGLTFAAGLSRNGKATSTTSPFAYPIDLSPVVVDRVCRVIPGPGECLLREDRKRRGLSSFGKASRDSRIGEDQTIEALLIDSYRPAKLYDVQMSSINPPPHRPLTHLQSLCHLADSQKRCGRSLSVRYSHPRFPLLHIEMMGVFTESSDSRSMDRS